MKKVSALTVAVVLCLCVLSFGTNSVSAGPDDCIDSCFTACVQRDTRVMQRCEGKCRIRCGPDAEAEDVNG